jgi:hypothetical protein
MNIEDYIATHCIAGTEKVGRQLPIRVINNLILKIIVLFLTYIIGLTSLHQESRPLMFYSLDFLQPMFYDWCTSLLANIKRQLIDFKQGRKRKLRFISILSSFIFERVLGLGPRVDIVLHGLCDPTIE